MNHEVSNIKLHLISYSTFCRYITSIKMIIRVTGLVNLVLMLRVRLGFLVLVSSKDYLSRLSIFYYTTILTSMFATILTHVPFILKYD